MKIMGLSSKNEQVESYLKLQMNEWNFMWVWHLGPIDDELDYKYTKISEDEFKTILNFKNWFEFIFI